MKLIAEFVSPRDVKPIVESTDHGKTYHIEGVFLQSEIKNRNGRIYPQAVLEREVARYNEEYVSQNRALGELGHPDSPHINLDRVSHMITNLTMDGTNFIGRAKIMDTPYGKIVKSFIDEDVKFGVSSRGVGSLLDDNDESGSVVGEDFYLSTAADIVADPSAPDAFVSGLRESKEWIWTNGVLSHEQMYALDRQISMAPVKSGSDSRKLTTKVFESFLRELKIGTRIT
jgi:hypothetical protein